MNDIKDQDDELSFREFKEQLQLLQRFANAVRIFLFTNLKRYFLLVVLLLAVFAALACYQYKKSRVFEAKASFIYTELQKKTYGEMLDKLDYMIQSGSYNKVAAALSLPLAEARTVLSISAENIYGSRLSEDITENKKMFYIDVISTDNKVFDSLQYSIERYLNNNILVKELTSAQTKVLQQKIGYLKEELQMMDSLKRAYAGSLDKASASLSASATPFNPVLLYEKSEKMLHDMTAMQALVDDSRSVKIQDGFMITEHPYGKSALTFAVKYFVFFLASSILLFFILSIFKKQ